MANKEVLDQINAEKITRTRALHDDHPTVMVTLDELAESWAREADLLGRSQKKGWQSEAKRLSEAAALLRLEVIAIGKLAATKPPAAVREPITGPTPSWTDPAALRRLTDEAEAKGLGRVVEGELVCPGITSHDAHTWVGPESKRWQCPGPNYSDGPCTTDTPHEPHSWTSSVGTPWQCTGRKGDDSIAAYLAGDTDTLALGFGTVKCVQCGGPVTVDQEDCPTCLAKESSGPTVTLNPDTVRDAIERLGTHLATESAVHQQVDQEAPDVRADPIVPAFSDSSTPAARTRLIPPAGVDLAPYSWADLAAPPSSVPDHLSPSQLSTLDTCPAQARISRYDNNPGIPLWANVGGTAFHKCVEEIERSLLLAGVIQDYAGREHLQVIWSRVFHSVITETVASSGVPMVDWYASKSGKENYSWWLVEGGEMLHRYVTYRATTANDGRTILVLPDGRPAIELELTLPIDHFHPDVEGGDSYTETLNVKVILDLVWRLVDGSLEIWDHKTRSDYFGPIVDTIQLGTQQHALRRAIPATEYPFGIQAGYFDARKGAVVGLDDMIEKHPIEELEMRYADADDKRRNRPAIPVRSNLCKACPVAYLCPVGSKL